MPSHYLVVSDLHVTDVEEHEDGWKAYKSARHSVDGELGALLESVSARHRTGGEHDGEPLTLVLNGDIVDFDLVTAVPDDGAFAVSRFERKRGLLPTPEKSAWKLRRVLDDHPVFMEALARFAADGHGIVYVLGNHDRELHFTQVQEVFTAAVTQAATRLGLKVGATPIRFEPWFYYVPGEIYAEHGQQYDYYSSFKHVLSPVVQTRVGPMLALPMGDLANRYLIGLMGYFNPHASDFVLNVFRYLAHWFRFYAFSRRGIVFNWFWGSILVMAQLLLLKKRIHARPVNYDACLSHAARRAKLPLAKVAALGALQPPPITTRFFRIAREFWIDRVVMALVMSTGTIALALSPSPLWLKLMVPLSSFPLLYFVYEWLVKGDTIFTAEREIPSIARRISDLLGVKVVTFGHTHKPRVLPLASGVSFVDTGTWAPMTSKLESASPLPGYRNYLLVDCDANSASVRLDTWEQRQGEARQAPRMRIAS